jgi:hypothetical protein
LGLKLAPQGVREGAARAGVGTSRAGVGTTGEDVGTSGDEVGVAEAGDGAFWATWLTWAAGVAVVAAGDGTGDLWVPFSDSSGVFTRY